MATYRVLSILFCRTYRLYFLIFTAILILQLILAISFYKVRIDDRNVLYGGSTPEKKDSFKVFLNCAKNCFYLICLKFEMLWP